MTIADLQIWKKFWWQWLIACVIAKLLQIFVDGLAGWFASTTGMRGLTEDGSMLLLVLVLFRLISGALEGFVQWQVLKHWLSSARYWVLATSIGSAIALAAINILWKATFIPPANIVERMMPPLSILPQFVFDGLYGILLGVAQWFVLRKIVPQAGWWIPVSCIGIILNSAVIGGLQQLIGPSGIEVSQSAWNPVFWAMASIGIVFYAFATGSFLVWSLRQRKV